MSEKLTRGQLHEYACDIWGGGGRVPDEDAEELLWARIEADREETRTEVLTEEQLKSWTMEFDPHLSDLWHNSFVHFLIEKIRRPPKKRAMTREEKLESIFSRVPYLKHYDSITDKTLDAILGEMGIPTEVDE